MLTIEEGAIRVIHCYDISEEINLRKVSKILNAESIKLEHKRLKPDYMQFRKPPLLVKIGKVEKTIEDIHLEVRIFAKIYAFGVISLLFDIDFSGSLDELHHIGAKLELENIFKKDAHEVIAKLRRYIRPALLYPEKKVDFAESFTIFSAKKFNRNITSDQLLVGYRDKIGAIVRQESRSLSKKELDGATKHNFSYFPSDLVVIDWNGAFVFDEDKSYEVLDLVEFCVVQHLELRAYDTFLDSVLNKAYDDIDRTRRSFLPITPYTKILDKLLYVRLEVMEVVEKVENSLKLIGDPYLAKVYSITAQSFHLNKWEDSLRKKINVLESTYSSMVDKVQETRMLILEAMIVILIVFDIAVYMI